MPETLWTSETIQYSAVEGNAEATVTVSEGRWYWSVTGNQFTCSGFADDHEAAKESAARGLDLIDQLVEMQAWSAVLEKPTDKIDMADPDGLGCLLCEKNTQTQCLHDASEVRAAFRLALRLGKHVPERS